MQLLVPLLQELLLKSGSASSETVFDCDAGKTNDEVVVQDWWASQMVMSSELVLVFQSPLPLLQELLLESGSASSKQRSNCIRGKTNASTVKSKRKMSRVYLKGSDESGADKIRYTFPSKLSTELGMNSSTPPAAASERTGPFLK